MKILITENQLRNLTDVLINEENDGVKYAIIKILKPLAYMDLKYYYQEVPLWYTKQDKITIKKGGAGTKTISTKNIEVVKVFDSDNEELKEYLKELRKNQST